MPVNWTCWPGPWPKKALALLLLAFAEGEGEGGLIKGAVDDCKNLFEEGIKAGALALNSLPLLRGWRPNYISYNLFIIK